MTRARLSFHDLWITPHKCLICAICLALMLPVAVTGLVLWLAYGWVATHGMVAVFAGVILVFWLFLMGILQISYRGRDLLKDFA
ncbi:MAG: hypothetical protein CVV27_12570 [Candidatus Melainabacteria bacterium HGW-Melainabacteria-1]|nr:MAG: hypothetical protein CVV27_12570 [Candidatus Melainabacteria bacterium HGW-Melainabacteria-1]